MFPGYKDIELPLLREIIRRGGRSSPSSVDQQGRTVYEALADDFDLSDDERKETFLDEGKPRSKWENMVRWARRKLKDHGYLDSPCHAIWEVTPAGREFAASLSHRQ